MLRNILVILVLLAMSLTASVADARALTGARRSPTTVPKGKPITTKKTTVTKEKSGNAQCKVKVGTYSKNKSVYTEAFLKTKKSYGDLCNRQGEVNIKKLLRTSTAFARVAAKLSITCKATGNEYACASGSSYIVDSATVAASAFAQIFASGECGDCQLDTVVTAALVKTMQVEVSAMVKGDICVRSYNGEPAIKRCKIASAAMGKAFIKVALEVFSKAVGSGTGGCEVAIESLARVSSNPMVTLNTYNKDNSIGLESSDVCETAETASEDDITD